MSKIRSISKYWHSKGILIIIITFIFVIFLVVVVRKMKGLRGTSNTFQNSFLDWRETFPQAFQTSGYDSNMIKSQAPPRDSKGELLCRNYLETKFKLPFPKQRPQFLKNPVTKGALLELDCYNENLQLAVEYQGRQHYVFTPHFHKNYETFLNQKYRDELKRILCSQNNVDLIEVPYYIEDIEDYLEEALKKWTEKHRSESRLLQKNEFQKNLLKKNKYFKNLIDR